MRTTILVALFALIAWGVSGSVVTAQMMGCDSKGQHQTEKTAAGSHMSNPGGMKGMMGKGDGMKGGMMDKMSSRCAMMSDGLEQMQAQVDQMLQITDLQELRTELQSFRDNLTSMNQSMAEHQQMCRQMMSSMMSSDGMSGMMPCGGKAGPGTDSTGSGHEQHH